MSNARCKNTESVRDHFSLAMTQAHPSRGLDGPDRMSIDLRADSDDGAARAWSDWSPSAATDDSSAPAELSTLALDMVDRFLDVMRVERFAAGATLREYRSHLHAAESWLRRFAGRTLITASSKDLVRHLREVAVDCELAARMSRLERRRRSLRRFYQWMYTVHARADDPMADSRLTGWWARHVRGERRASQPDQRVMRAAIRERNCLMIAMMLSSGLGARDIVELRLHGLPRIASDDETLGGLLQDYIEGSRNTILAGRRSEFLFPSRFGTPLKDVVPWRGARFFRALSPKSRGAQ